jgi:hypothetical protein
VSTEQYLTLASVALGVLTLFLRYFYNRGFDAGASLTAEEVRARDELARLEKENPSTRVLERKQEIDDALSRIYMHDDGASAAEAVRRLRRLHDVARKRARES